jgi:hypothetical protein
MSFISRKTKEHNSIENATEQLMNRRKTKITKNNINSMPHLYGLRRFTISCEIK